MCAGMLLMFWVFQIPQLAGERFLALAALLGLFALAALPLTYLLNFMFQARTRCCKLAWPHHLDTLTR